MSDDILGAIDRFYDGVDRIVDTVTGSVDRVRKLEDRADEKSQDATVSSETALVAPRYRLIEAIDAETGRATFVVTDGKVRCECDTRGNAEKILAAINKGQP